MKYYDSVKKIISNALLAFSYSLDYIVRSCHFILPVLPQIKSSLSSMEEYPDDEQLIKNAALFISVRENSAAGEKLESVRKCLERGADVNAADANDGFNTPLHVAARRGDAGLARLLLQRGADPALRNWRGLTALDVARARRPPARELERLLSEAEHDRTRDDGPAQSSDDVRSKCDAPPSTTEPTQFTLNPRSVGEANNNNYVENSDRFKFPKRLGTSGVCGQLYETKLLQLIQMRAEDDKEIEQHYLGSNIRGIGDMDDICLKVLVRGRSKPIALFVQAKHRENCDKNRLTVEDVLSDSGDYSLRKYFGSYLAIKEQFRADNEDPMFKGDFSDIECYFVLYTPAKECFAKKKTDNRLNQKMHDLISTASDGKIFQYDYDEDDLHILVNMIAKDQCKNLGMEFVNFIMHESNNVELDKLILKYHVILSRQVVRQCNKHGKIQYHNNMWEFRPEFIKSNSEYLIVIKKLIIRELSTKQFDRSKITKEDRENLKRLLQKPNGIAIISKLIGKLLTYNHKSKKLQIIDSSSLRNDINSEELQTLLKRFHETEISESYMTEAVEMKMESLQIKLPVSFGNLDMSFRGSEVKIKRRIEHLASTLEKLFHNNNETKVVEINDEVIGPIKLIEKGFIKTSGGIGSAVGNLFIFDEDTKMLKIDVDNKKLPKNAALLLHQLKHERNKFTNEQIASYRFNININNFPKYSFDDEDNNIKKQVTDFLNKLWFYTGQYQEDHVENMLRELINEKQMVKKYYSNFPLKSEILALIAQNTMQKWWMTTECASYLTQATQFFQRTRQDDLDNIIVSILSHMHALELHYVEWEFKSASQTHAQKEKKKMTKLLISTIYRLWTPYFVRRQSKETVSKWMETNVNFKEATFILRIFSGRQTGLQVSVLGKEPTTNRCLVYLSWSWTGGAFGPENYNEMMKLKR